MSIRRRSLLLSALGAAIATPVLAQAPASSAPTVQPDPLKDGLAARRLPLTLRGGRFSGPGWDLIAREAVAAKFTLLGEDHGLVEVPALATALWSELRPAGYDRVALEISPLAADALDEALRRGGMAAYRRLLADPDFVVAFYGMAEEAAFLSAVRSSVPGARPMLWGLDYEVGSDRRVIAELARHAPPSARAPLEALRRASQEAWETRTGEYRPFMFTGDAALVSAVRRAWPAPDAASAQRLELLEQSLEINAHNTAQRFWESNNQRALLNRAAFVRHWRAERAQGRSPKVMFKFGAYHMTRGRTATGVFDIGTLAHELAVSEGGKALHILALAAPGSQQARFDIRTRRYAPGAADSFAPLRIVDLAPPPGAGHTVLDLRPLRPLLAASPAARANGEIVRVVQGFDLLVTFSPSTASANL